VLAAAALARLPGWSPMADVAFSVALAALAMWGVTGMLQRNIELAQAQATIAELAVQNERTRFARDLHDILGHSLTVLTVKAELAGRLVPIDPVRAEREIGEVERLARDALADVRAAVAGYREVSLAVELATAKEVLAAAGIAAVLLVHLQAYRGLLDDPTDPVVTGRYLLPLLPILGVGVAAVLDALPRRAFAVAGGGVLGVAVLLQLAALGAAVTRFYA
jgi:two-component system sensor histidine kinase DesK